jgi:hypothetical protein
VGTSSSQVLEGSPFVCLLKCWKDNLWSWQPSQKGFDFLLHSGLDSISLRDQETWPEGGTLNYESPVRLVLQEGGQTDRNSLCAAVLVP